MAILNGEVFTFRVASKSTRETLRLAIVELGGSGDNRLWDYTTNLVMDDTYDATTSDCYNVSTYLELSSFKLTFLLQDPNIATVWNPGLIFELQRKVMHPLCRGYEPTPSEEQVSLHFVCGKTFYR
jgi:hypothetical protein